MRQSPRRVPNMEDAGAEGHEASATDVAKIVETTNEPPRPEDLLKNGLLSFMKGSSVWVLVQTP